jgi:hypothetical protein
MSARKTLDLAHAAVAQLVERKLPKLGGACSAGSLGQASWLRASDSSSRVLPRPPRPASLDAAVVRDSFWISGAKGLWVMSGETTTIRLRSGEMIRLTDGDEELLLEVLAFAGRGASAHLAPDEIHALVQALTGGPR